MTWTDVDDMTVANVSGSITVNNESVGSNTGSPFFLVSITKTESEWGGLEPYQSVSNNSHAILQSAINVLKANYAGKEIDLDGIVITETEV